MPELPEVETVKNGLIELLDLPASIVDVRRSSQALRFSMPRGFKTHLKDQSILGIQRRAKYLLFDLGDRYLLNHLGMTGSWRIHTALDKRKHDHVFFRLNDNRWLIYNDPRRFGYFDVLKKENWQQEKWFQHLGPEPLSDEFNVDYLKSKLKGRSGPIKNIIMDQKVVVGVGNIYASEALFLAGIRPTAKAGKIPKLKLEAFVEAIKKVLSAAISQGGTTISDFKQAGGSEGYFQMQLRVYGREGQLCNQCQQPIFQVRLGGRSSFYCKICQK
tara:strand:+ start:131289 stop:132107 length:819 start_codon:yes stop_codon:yes gene_type:complete